VGGKVYILLQVVLMEAMYLQSFRFSENEIRKNATVECLDYQIPTTQLKKTKGRWIYASSEETDLSNMGICGRSIDRY